MFGNLARAVAGPHPYCRAAPQPEACELSSPVWQSLSGRGAIRDRLGELIRSVYAPSGWSAQGGGCFRLPKHASAAWPRWISLTARLLRKSDAAAAVGATGRGIGVAG